MADNKKFIRTSDKETADKLQDEGLQLVQYANGVWVFINDYKINYASNEKVVYTNKLCV